MFNDFKYSLFQKKLIAGIHMNMPSLILQLFAASHAIDNSSKSFPKEITISLLLTCT